MRLSLTLLKTGILFVDHQQFTLAANDFAVCTSFLDGSSYFHESIVINLLVYFTYLYLKIIRPLLKS